MNRRRTPLVALALLALAMALLACRPQPEESYARGVSALERGDWAAAARAFEAAGDLADAPERAAEARALVEDVQAQYDAARAAMRARRWFDAYVALERVIAVAPGQANAVRDLARVSTKLDELLARAQAKLDVDDPEAAAELWEAAGAYRQADDRALQARMLADELQAMYDHMVGAARQGDWATALSWHEALAERAPRYRDVDRLRSSYLRQGYRAAEQALADGRQAEALNILMAVTAIDPAYRDARQLLQQARVNAVHELMGVHAFRRVVGKHRGWELQLDSVEVRPEGELLVRATAINITSQRNHLACLQNDEAQPTIYLLAAGGQQVEPQQWACQQWRAQEWDILAGESMSFWWLYPALDDITAPFTLVFEPWGEVEAGLLRP